MPVRIDPALPEDASAIATMVGELLHEIMAAIGEPVFGFDHNQTAARARAWLTEGRYRVLIARDGMGQEPLGFLALYEGYALYAEGALGTIPELFVRPACRSKGIGAALVAEAKRIGRSKGGRGSKSRRLRCRNSIERSPSIGGRGSASRVDGR